MVASTVMARYRMRGRVSGYAWSCLRHSHDAPPGRIAAVFPMVTLILTSPSSSLANARGCGVEVKVSALCVRIQWLRAVHIGLTAGRQSGLGEQRGDGGAEKFLGLRWAEAELGAQRLPERPDADRVQAFEQLLALLSASLVSSGAKTASSSASAIASVRALLRLSSSENGRAGGPPASWGHLLQDPGPLAGEQGDPYGQRLVRIDPLHQGSQDLVVAAIRLDQQRLHVGELLPDRAQRHASPLSHAQGGRAKLPSACRARIASTIARRDRCDRAARPSAACFRQAEAARGGRGVRRHLSQSA